MEEQETKPNEPGPADSWPRGLLYHYTDQRGLLGILESGCIWATHIRFLNDLSESREALDCWSAALREINSNNPILPAAYWPAAQWAVEFAIEEFAPYLASFTEDNDPKSEGDRLSQWRGYAPNRPGFSLGFKGPPLLSKASQTVPSDARAAELLRCEYDERRKHKLVLDLAGTHAEAVRKWGKELRKDPGALADKDYAARLLFEQLFPLQGKMVELSATFKHSGFREESEWRLVLNASGDPTRQHLIQFREGLFGQTPYVEVPLGLKDQDSPLKRIVVGPSPNKEQAVKWLKIAIAKMGIKGVEIVPSKIPYRNW